jgi:hypothetical protein
MLTSVTIVTVEVGPEALWCARSVGNGVTRTGSLGRCAILDRRPMYPQRLVAHPDLQAARVGPSGSPWGIGLTRAAPQLRYFAGTSLPAEVVNLVPIDLPDDGSAAHRLIDPGTVA